MDLRSIVTVVYVMFYASSANEIYSHRSVRSNYLQPDDNMCSYTLWEQSKIFFQSRLESLDPNFVRFIIDLNVTNPNSTQEAFFPLKWVWTYSSPTDSYPYLSWNIDHGLLSFGLLDAKTCDIPYIKIFVPDHCGVLLGSNDTTWRIVDALKDIFVSNNKSYLYEKNFFCFLEEAHGIRDTFQYQAALYLNYPVSFLNYRCCNIYYNYVSNTYDIDCNKEQHKKWRQLTLGPYVIGLIIFMYFPVALFNISAWLSKNEVIKSNDSNIEEGYENLDDDKAERNWVNLNGVPPITFLDCFNVFEGLDRQHGVLVSRIRRLISILIVPVVIYIQIGLYADGIDPGNKYNITVDDLVNQGMPLGFLALLGKDKMRAFAPKLGGPLCLLCVYHILAIAFVVLPKSLKQIVELGMPSGHSATPLFLSVNEIIQFSMLSLSPKPGYEKGAVVCKCSLYMMFTRSFWAKVFEIQRQRLPLHVESQRWVCAKNFAYVILLPVYILFCLIEIIVCIFVYAFPFCSLISIIVRGAVKSIIMLQSPNRSISVTMSIYCKIVIGTITIFTSFIVFCYSVCLIFVQSFSFISQIIIYCFVAVIVYPSTSFGYLFFVVVLLYYILRQIKRFGERYSELLELAVEKSSELYNQKEQEPPKNMGSTNNQSQSKISEKYCVFRIPRPLFEYLVQRHRPVHIEVLKTLFHLVMIIFIVAMTLSIISELSHGASSEISDAMHVIFIVTVGALPHVLELALANTSGKVRREIELRLIERSIIEYWTNKSGED